MIRKANIKSATSLCKLIFLGTLVSTTWSGLSTAQTTATTRNPTSVLQSLNKLEKSTDVAVMTSKRTLDSTQDENIRTINKSLLVQYGKIYYEIGLTLNSGAGVRKDQPRAIEIFRKAALLGNVDAQFTLGLMFDTGDGAQKNGEESKQFYQMAADNGDVRAEKYLGLKYLEGRDIPKDYVRAANLLLKAADKGDPLSQSAMSEMYAEGMGVARDEVLAYMWANLSAARSDVSKSERDELENKMTPEQVAQAQLLTQKWIATHAALNE